MEMLTHIKYVFKSTEANCSDTIDSNQDPHDELKNQNVLIVTGSEVETAEKFGISLEETKQALKQIQQILHLARQNRPRPHLDDKMVAAWNGEDVNQVCLLLITEMLKKV
jgi:uncharacterized protein YyaL (SSP411 family)